MSESPNPADQIAERLRALGIVLPAAEVAVIARGHELLARWLDRVRREP